MVLKMCVCVLWVCELTAVTHPLPMCYGEVDSQPAYGMSRPLKTLFLSNYLTISLPNDLNFFLVQWPGKITLIKPR